MIHGHPPQRAALFLLNGAAFTLSGIALFPTLTRRLRLPFFLTASQGTDLC